MNTGNFNAMATSTNKTPLLQRFLQRVEVVGNALPQPAILFLFLSAFVVALSALLSSMGLSAVHPVKKESIEILNLFSIKGLHYGLTEMVKNFSGFAPLGTVLTVVLGFSIAEKSGLLAALLRLIVLRSPRALLVPAVLTCGVVSHTAGDIGYVLLIPLAAMAFHSAGLNPLAGLAICFAGVSGGFAANFLLSTADTLLSALSTEAARIIDPKYVVTPLANYYFMATSSLLIVGIGTLVANKITLPFVGEYRGSAERDALEELNPVQKKGLGAALITTLVLVGLLLWGTIPLNGFLRDPSTDFFHSPALKGSVALIFIFGSLTGLAYGFTAKTFKSSNDVVNAMQEGMATLAPYLVLVFFASQFISLFNVSNIGLVLAVRGAEIFKTLQIGAMPLMLGFILLTVLLDLVIGSASAKWALIAPIFVPMFMLLGISPELSQASYRIADSVVNIISPLMSYFPLVLAFAAKYDSQAKVGTVVALMLPYSLCFLIFWSLLLFAWMLLGWPLGPGAPLHYIMPS